MSESAVVRVTGTADAAEIAAVLAAISARPAPAAEPGGYDHWRTTRLTALRRSRRPGRTMARPTS